MTNGEAIAELEDFSKGADLLYDDAGGRVPPKLIEAINIAIQSLKVGPEVSKVHSGDCTCVDCRWSGT